MNTKQTGEDGYRPLEGQVAIVTGAATGIGAGIAVQLARRGADVTLNMHNQSEQIASLIDQIHAAGGKAIAFEADVSDPAHVAQMVEETVRTHGRLDIMIANAGIQVDAPALEMTVEQWDKAMAVDLRGAFLCAQAAARQFVKQGVHPDISKAAGKICLTLSVHDTIPWMGHVNYATAKGGARMMMQTLAQEWAQYRIRVFGISPGAIKTPINESVWGNAASYKELLKLVPYGRIGEVEDVAKVCAFLCSDDADYITGTTTYIDGGMLQYPGFMGNG